MESELLLCSTKGPDQSGSSKETVPVKLIRICLRWLLCVTELQFSCRGLLCDCHFKYRGCLPGRQLKPALLGPLSLMSSNAPAPSYTHPVTAREHWLHTHLLQEKWEVYTCSHSWSKTSANQVFDQSKLCMCVNEYVAAGVCQYIHVHVCISCVYVLNDCQVQVSDVESIFSSPRSLQVHWLPCLTNAICS